MKRFFSILLPVLFAALSQSLSAAPDTVRTGIYITSIHDIDFRQQEYSINCWLWLTYTNPEFNFIQNLEIPQAKSFTKSYTTVDSSDGRIYILMKLQCVMKDYWKITDFPFDRQKLRFTVENAQFDSEKLVFEADTIGDNYHRFTVRGWEIDSISITTDTRKYKTTFGDPSLQKPDVEYGEYKVKIGLVRNAWGLFWKIFLGMYVSFLIAITCLRIRADNIDSRLALSVGALFTAIGNKYVTDSSLPESSTFTLVDTLHGITLLFIFAVIGISVRSLRLAKENHMDQSNRLDQLSFRLLLSFYILLNVFFVWLAI
jgi:hypothetical protein